MRRSLALLLLCAHASAAVHVALAAHTLADSGAVVEVQPECSEPGHGSDGIAHGHELQGEERECEAVALLRSVAHTKTPVLPLAVATVSAPNTFTAAAASPPLEVLSVAPKSSPPV